MLFRGTARYGSLEIDQLFDAMGAELNAGTGKETTSVYSRVLDVHLERALDVMADMVWRPRFDAEELDQEREIVLEEIAMYEDDPQDKVFDVLGEAVFGDHPLGRAIIGRARRRGAARPRRGLAAFHAARYVPGNVVVAAAGSVDHDAARRARRARRRRACGALRRRRRRRRRPPRPTSRARALRGARTPSSTTSASARPGIARDDERRFALRVLDNVLGGTSSSRLFQEVREKRGLAYAVYSFQALYAGTGQVGLYLGTRPENVAAALRVVADELERFAPGPGHAPRSSSAPRRTSRAASCCRWSPRRRG